MTTTFRPTGVMDATYEVDLSIFSAEAVATLGGFSLQTAAGTVGTLPVAVFAGHIGRALRTRPGDERLRCHLVALAQLACIAQSLDTTVSWA